VTPAAGPARKYRAPAGLLEKLVAAVRPEFRAEDLVFDPRDPVFGGPRTGNDGGTPAGNRSSRNSLRRLTRPGTVISR
jgi:hypothetical protein